MAARIVLFDLGKVVLDWDPARLYSKIFNTPQERDAFLSDICTMSWHTRHDAGVGFAENAEELIREHPEYEAEIRAWGGRWMEMFDGYVEGTSDLIARLDARDVPLFALTNMPSETWPLMVQHFPLVETFRHVFVSGDLEMVKPDPAIYQHVLQRVGAVAPSDVFFIDDSAKNIEAANALGICTHHFSGVAGLEAALVAEGLL